MCDIAKIYVTCFVEDPVSGPLCNAEPTSASPTTPVSELTTATSVASPPQTTTGTAPHTTTGTGSVDSTNGNTDSSTNVGAPRSGSLSTTYTIITFIGVCIVAALFLFVAVTFAAVKYKRKRSDTTSVHHKKCDPVTVNESVLYSELTDVPMEQSQQESCPIYETIMTIPESTARISATDVCSSDLKENIAYEASPADLKENIAYETHLNPVDLLDNIAYETSKKIITQTNEAYGAF
jgi:hypothetical protein